MNIVKLSYFKVKKKLKYSAIYTVSEKRGCICQWLVANLRVNLQPLSPPAKPKVAKSQRGCELVKRRYTPPEFAVGFINVSAARRNLLEIRANAP